MHLFTVHRISIETDELEDEDGLSSVLGWMCTVLAVPSDTTPSFQTAAISDPKEDSDSEGGGGPCGRSTRGPRF